MSTHRSLPHALMRIGGSAGRARHATSGCRAYARAARGILVLGLILGALAVAALTLPGHSSASGGESSHSLDGRQALDLLVL
jgi:hypothetical protein